MQAQAQDETTKYTTIILDIGISISILASDQRSVTKLFFNYKICLLYTITQNERTFIHFHVDDIMLLYSHSLFQIFPIIIIII